MTTSDAKGSDAICVVCCANCEF